jgi:uncharacterized membrane protein (DUF2068 family)
MTDENAELKNSSNESAQPHKSHLPLPGMAGIALYMLAISGVIAFGVVGHHIPAIFLIVSLLTACASFGLLRLQRWGWALSLAATFLLMLYQFYVLFRSHQGSAGVMGALNLVLFLYLVRPEVIERLR